MQNAVRLPCCRGKQNTTLQLTYFIPLERANFNEEIYNSNFSHLDELQTHI